ncbi:FMN-dependent NADH-azoreductase [Chitinophaga parva]|uniref:FMN dependent NADH:quinone oxidoreductase n=1 Tax=Chitinophaga parva TaxID=2169414 RepID=A0A2T7BQF3_9BACT|nr:NAD(P)H-dependent oxidoreductase [Chitinophaga parva]PUZ29892.1 FMN-dependent NADH-azoreductase [Chitinophaga parva]
MKRILHILSSPRTTGSASRKLGHATISKIIDKYPGSLVEELDLAIQPVPHLEKLHIDAFFTAEDLRSPAQRDAVTYSDAWIAALQTADIIVVEAPMYNFTIPSTLKAFFDHLARVGITFRYTGNGLLPEGLLKNKQAYIVTSSGGIYSTGELKQYDFATPLVHFFLTLIGMEVVAVFRAEGQAIVGQEAALESGLASISIK